MPQGFLDKAKAVDQSVLAQMVRQDQGEPGLEILNWTVTPLNTKGMANPEGILLYTGRARAGQTTKPWSVVLKMIRNPRRSQDLYGGWKRELLAFQSGLLANLPAAVVTPRFYAAIEDEDDAWLWMEHIATDSNCAWTLDDYYFAARQAGRFNGAYVTSLPLPDFPWLGTGGPLRGWVSGLDPTNAWESPFVREAFSPALQTRIMALWTERERFFAVLDRLPQTFSHFDWHRRNLFRRRQTDGHDEIVAVDWALCGVGALGAELRALTFVSAGMFEVDAAVLPELDTVAIEGYLAGLHDAGWAGDPQMVRLAYTAWVSLYAVGMPAITARYTSETMHTLALQVFNHQKEELAHGWAAMCEFFVGRADEAWALMDSLTLT